VPLHPLAATGFADVAQAYDRGRPDYPPEAVAALGLPDRARVLDLAAGTGKLTRVLRAAGLDVVPVEPLPAMRALVPGALDGTAEAIPLPDASVDAATIADAWHWFDHPRASAELARVVRPGGVVAILWQYPGREGLAPWAHDLGQILLPLRGEHPGFAAQMSTPADHADFEPHTEQSVPFSYKTDRERYGDFVSSISYVASLPEAERADVLARVVALLPEGPFVVPYETRVWLSRRRSAPA
jgi:SAM-dependent methyltransferase